MLERDIDSNYLSTNVRIADLVRVYSDLVEKKIKLKMKLLQTISPTLAANYALDIFCTPMAKRNISKEAQDVFSTANTKLVEVNGNSVKIYIFGDGNDKNIFLAHGWESRASELYLLINSLVGNGYRVITLDAPAHGLSSGTQTNILDYGHAISQIAESFKCSFEAFIGHSFGSGAILKALTSNKKININKVITIGSPNKFSEIFSQYSKVMNLNDKTKNKMREIFKSRAGVDFNDVSIEKMFIQVDVKGLVIHDLTDKIVSIKCALEICENNAKLTLYKTDGLGHTRILNNFHVHQDIVDFLFE